MEVNMKELHDATSKVKELYDATLKGSFLHHVRISFYLKNCQIAFQSIY